MLPEDWEPATNRTQWARALFYPSFGDLPSFTLQGACRRHGRLGLCVTAPALDKEAVVRVAQFARRHAFELKITAGSDCVSIVFYRF